MYVIHRTTYKGNDFLPKTYDRFNESTAFYCNWQDVVKLWDNTDAWTTFFSVPSQLVSSLLEPPPPLPTLHHLFRQLRAITLPQSPSGRLSLHRAVRYGFQPDHSWIDTFLSSQPRLAGYPPPSSSGRNPPDPNQYTFSVYSNFSRTMENRPP